MSKFRIKFKTIRNKIFLMNQFVTELSYIKPKLYSLSFPRKMRKSRLGKVSMLKCEIFVPESRQISRVNDIVEIIYIYRYAENM